MPLSIERKHVEPDIVVLEISGKITMGPECLQIEKEVDQLIGGNEKKVIFDFSAVDYLDSTGVGIIAICAGKLNQAGGKLRVAGAQGMVQQVFNVVRMESVVDVYPTAAAARENFTVEGAGPANQIRPS